MSQHKDSISVIVPCFNSEATIIRALDSVLHQTRLPSEIIVIDDASSDRSCELVEAFAQRQAIPVVLIRQPCNGGPSLARNTGWDRAGGEYIAFLDADDVWLPAKLEKQLQFLSDHPGTIACGHGFSVLTDDHTAAPDLDEIRYFGYRELLVRNRFSTPAIMVRRDIDLRFPERLRGAEDYSLWLDIAHRHGPIPKLMSMLGGCHKRLYGESGLSGRLLDMERAELAVLKTQYAAGRVGFCNYLVLVGWSCTRFLLRAARSALAKLRMA